MRPPRKEQRLWCRVWETILLQIEQSSRIYNNRRNELWPDYTHENHHAKKSSSCRWLSVFVSLKPFGTASRKIPKPWHLRTNKTLSLIDGSAIPRRMLLMVLPGPRCARGSGPGNEPTAHHPS